MLKEFENSQFAGFSHKIVEIVSIIFILINCSFRKLGRLLNYNIQLKRSHSLFIKSINQFNQQNRPERNDGLKVASHDLKSKLNCTETI